MTELLGKALVLAGCSAYGLLRGLELKKRGDCLEDFWRFLARVSRELSFSLRPIPDLMAQTRGEGWTADFAAACLEAFAAAGRESWAESWRETLDQTTLPLKEADRALLREAGEVLGRYDGDSQRQALAGILARLEENRGEARREAQRLFRVYAALGIAGGLFVCLLL